MMELSASRWAKPDQEGTSSQTKADSIQNTPLMAQSTPFETQDGQPKTLTNGSASKVLKPGDPGFVNPYAKYVADLDPSGAMDDGRYYVGRSSHYVDQSPTRSTRGSNNRNQSFRPPQRQEPQPTQKAKPAIPSPTPSWISSSGRKPAPQANGKSSRYSTAQSGREYHKSRWSGQPLATSSQLPEGFFGTAKGTAVMIAPSATAPIATTTTPSNNRRGSRGDDRDDNQRREGWGETRSNDGWAESQQPKQAAWKPIDNTISTAESVQAFFGTPKDVRAKKPTSEAQPSWASKSDDIHQSMWTTPEVSRGEFDRSKHGLVDQTKVQPENSGWFTTPASDRKDRPIHQPLLAPPSSASVQFEEQGVVKEQGRPPSRHTDSVPPRPASQEGDPLVIQYPVGDGCWVKMVVYVERDSKTAYNRLSGLGRRQISGIKVKTPEQLGEMVKDIVVDEKKNLLG